jgi:PAS domain S-box-containing protein
VFDAALDAIITIDHEGRVVEFNAAAERIFGVARTTARGALLANLIIPPRFREAHLKGIKRYLETGEGPVLGKRIEIAALRADGTEFPVELAITRVPDADPPLFTGFLRDLTERRRIERRRAALYGVAEILATAGSLDALAPALLATLCDVFEASFSALWIVDGDVLRCLRTHRPSPADTTADTFGVLSRGMTFAPGIGLPGRVWKTRTPHWIEDVLADDNFPRNTAARQQGLRGAFGFPIRLGDDVFAVLEFFSTRVLERDDDVVRVFHSIGNQMAQFIARKRAENDRAQLLVQEQQARRAAEQANTAKDEFLAVVSHELRTPLNSMLGWASLLKTGSLPDEKRARAVDAIERSARAQARLVEDLLDLSRMVRGTVALSCAPIDAAASARASIEMVQPDAQERGVSIVTEGLTQPVIVWADRARLQQIVWNLVSNAVKFTPAGGTVTVRLEPVGDQSGGAPLSVPGPTSPRVRIIVADTGVGIRPEFLPHLFERFRQADAGGTRSRGGLGLGLAIVRELVELHGGSVAAESEGEGKGSRFTVTLPTEADDRPAKRTPHG